MPLRRILIDLVELITLAICGALIGTALFTMFLPTPVAAATVSAELGSSYCVEVSEMSTPIEIADAVVASLNSASFSMPLQAQRRYVPAVDLAELAQLHITVVPKQVTISSATRDSSYFDCSLDIGIQKKVDPDDLAELDGLVALAEEIVDHLRRTPLAGFPAATWLSVRHEPVFAPEHLDQQRVFTSVISATYRVRR